MAASTCQLSPVPARSKKSRTSLLVALTAAVVGLLSTGVAHAEQHGELALKLPDFKSVMFLGTTGWNLLAWGLGICALGLVFGLVIYKQLEGMDVHKSMLEVSELIYATCKTYLIT